MYIQTGATADFITESMEGINATASGYRAATTSEAGSGIAAPCPHTASATTPMSELASWLRNMITWLVLQLEAAASSAAQAAVADGFGFDGQALQR